MKKFILVLVTVVPVSMFTGCFWNADKIKSMAPERLAEAGFSIVTLEGTQMSFTGGNVWYVLKKNSNEKGLYDACLSFMPSGDLGLYNLQSIDSTEVQVNK